MVNKNHPDFEKLKSEWDNLWNDYNKDMKIIDEEMKAKNIHSGKDGEGARRTKKLHLAIKKKKKKYAYLYE